MQRVRVSESECLFVCLMVGVFVCIFDHKYNTMVVFLCYQTAGYACTQCNLRYGDTLDTQCGSDDVVQDCKGYCAVSM